MLLILLTINIILLSIGQCRIDETLQANATGMHVAKAAIRKLQDSCIFSNDHQFLYRLAHVEMRRPSEGHRKSGLWGLSKANFDKMTMFRERNPKRYKKIVKAVKKKFKVDIEQLSYGQGDLNVPFNALLSTRMYLEFTLKNETPFIVEKQGKFWQYYKGEPTDQPFLREVRTMRPSCKSAGADILFVLDSSGSICSSRDCKYQRNCVGCKNYMKMFTLVKKVVQSLPYDARKKYQFAVDVFGSSVKHPIHFNSYRNVYSLLRKIDKMPYLSSGTATDKALKEALLTSFSTKNGARADSVGFPKVMVLMTDGSSDSSSRTRAASEKAKKAGIEIFTVGIGSAFAGSANKKELEAIASHPKCMHLYLVKNFESLGASFGDEIKSQTCHASASSFGNQSVIHLSVSPDNSKYFKFNVDTNKGAFLEFSCLKGSATMYLSTVENPDGTLYDHKLKADSSNSDSLYISPEKAKKLQKDASSEQKQYRYNLAKSSSMLKLYSSVIGHENDCHCKLGVHLKKPKQKATANNATNARKRLKSQMRKHLKSPAMDQLIITRRPPIPVTQRTRTVTQAPQQPACNRKNPVCTCACSCM